MLILVALLQLVTEPTVPPRWIPSAVLSAKDYPKAAILLGQEGDVVPELTVGTDGRPTNCTIISSSGSPALDAATCTAFMTRARFIPARDTLGRPTTGKWKNMVRWSIGGNELPVAPWTIRLVVGLDKTGNPTNCAIQSGGALKREEMTIDCRELSGAFTVPPDLARRYAGHETVLVFDQQFVPAVVPSIDSAPDLARFPLISREVMRLEINAGGRVGNCSRTISEGDYKPSVDGCDAMRGRRFKPDPNRPTRPLEATATTAIYTGDASLICRTYFFRCG